MLSVCEDVLLDDMMREDEMELFVDDSFHEAVDTLLGYDGLNTASMDVNNGLLFPQPMKKYTIAGEVEL